VEERLLSFDGNSTIFIFKAADWIHEDVFEDERLKRSSSAGNAYFSSALPATVLRRAVTR